MSSEEQVVAVVGLGYVGFPLAVEFGKSFRTIGYDVSAEKVRSIGRGLDPNGELTFEECSEAVHLECTTNPNRLSEATFIIVAVPTPVDESHKPDLSHLTSSSELVGRHLRRGMTVVYESTVYPGATEEVCIPVLESTSGLIWKKDFFVAYSPERINPGDREHTLTKVMKVVSGDTPETLERVAELYGSIIVAGIHRAPNIAVAEAAKVIENTQRDLNIALMNEVSILLHRLNIDTLDVLTAAETKWNFQPFRPGLVGGHCVGVDPYYLTHKAEKMGYISQVILAGRRINDQMAEYIAGQTVKSLVELGKTIQDSQVVVLGLTFKENCADIRNSQVARLVGELQEFGCKVAVHDPLADPDEAKRMYGISLRSWEELPTDPAALVLAVPHDHYRKMPPSQLLAGVREGALVVDVKSVLNRDELDSRALKVWRL